MRPIPPLVIFCTIICPKHTIITLKLSENNKRELHALLRIFDKNFTESRGVVGSNPTLYSANPRFEFPPGDQLS
jgi:hypothetical protein